MTDGAGLPATRTTCPYCGVGCGVLARPVIPGSVEISGDPEHPANFGRLCSKGLALGETVDLEGRLLYPEIGGQRVAWERAIAHVADGFRQTISEHGPDSVAFYVSGQLLTEDYYVANKLMKGFIGSANIDTNSRLCMASSVAGHKRAFGSDTVPGTYEDLELADLVVLTGSNLAWCHPVLFQRLLAARQQRPEMKIIVIDPRRTATAEEADLHLPIRAGGDVALFNGLLAWLARNEARDVDYIARHTTGLEGALSAACSSVEDVSMATGIPAPEIEAFFRLFADNDRTVTVYSQGINQAVDGTDRVNAILNCHLLTGRIGKPGAGPFSITGQPNAMGGREVGGLANQLACHMEIENPRQRDLVQNFWRSPVIADKPGMKAVDLFQAVSDGRIKAIWIMATNPVVSMPDANAVHDALKACPLVVVSDVEPGADTALLADVLLPAAAWGEKDGTVTNSERRISRQRSFLPLPGDARPDWRIISEVACAMGFESAFAYRTVSEIFSEYAALSAFENNGSRDFDIGALSGLNNEAYDRLQPIQWPVPSEGSTGGRFFANGGFFAEGRRGRFVPTPPRPAEPSRTEWFLLNTGRVRDHWHTMTRTGRSSRLSAHLAEPFVAMNPSDAFRLGVREAGLVRLSNERGQTILRALLSSAQPEGTVFAPMHWSGQWSGAARIDSLVAPDTDPVSGQPALKSSSVDAAPLTMNWYAFATSLQRPETDGLAYWALARSGPGYRLECADTGPLDQVRIRDLLRISGRDDLHTLTFLDNTESAFRLAAFDGDRLVAVWIAGPAPVLADRTWLAGLLGEPVGKVRERAAILAGRPGNAIEGPGALVCSCNMVGANTIRTAIAGGASSVTAVGQATQAGTGCGSCQVEIRRILENDSLAEAV